MLFYEYMFLCLIPDNISNSCGQQYKAILPAVRTPYTLKEFLIRVNLKKDSQITSQAR